MDAAGDGGVVVDWGYDAGNGPEVWADLDPSFALCRSGSSQSPIDLAAAERVSIDPVVVEYTPTRVMIANTGKTVRVDCDPGGSVGIDGTRYELVQFHFHTPSEHSVDGTLADGEIHLVHQAADGCAAVIGVLLSKGDRHRNLSAVIDHLPSSVGDPSDAGTVIDPTVLLPADRTFMRYDGSLTTPPCTEGVLWTMFLAPLELSAGQIGALRTLMHGNNRPVQPRNGRPLYLSVQ